MIQTVTKNKVDLPVSHLTPMKFGGHLHENLFPWSIHVAPFRHGEGLQMEAGCSKARKYRKVKLLIIL